MQTKERITNKNTNIDNNKNAAPLVSICCITFNHELYIEETLDSFLMQEVDFKYEIIIYDDKSTDRTHKILQTYKEKHPNIITIVRPVENLYSKGLTKIFYHGTIKRAKGKYIATCEGDDFWIDKCKLKKQVDFLEQNPDFNFSVGRYMVKDEFNGEYKEWQEPFSIKNKEYYLIKDYLKYYFSQTATYMFRSQGYINREYFNRFHGEDILMVVLGTREGKIKYHDDIFATYRRHSGGLTHKKHHWKTHYLDSLIYNRVIKELVGKKYWAVFKSIDLNLAIDYWLVTTRNRIIKKTLGGIRAINNFVRWKIL